MQKNQTNQTPNTIAQLILPELRQKWAEYWGIQPHMRISSKMLQKSLTFKMRHAQGEGLGTRRNLQHAPVHPHGFVAKLWIVRRKAGGDTTENRDVKHAGAVFLVGENHRTRHTSQPADHTFALQRSEMSHGGGLARESEVFLDVTRRRHHAVLALIPTQKFQQL